MSLRKGAALAVAVFAAFAAEGADPKGAVVGSAPREVVDAAAFGFSTNTLPSENTKALQKALDGGNRKVTISAPGCYRLDGTLYVDDNTDLCCAEGVLFRKAASYSHMILNRGALTGATNVNISIVGLSITDGGINVSPDPSSSLQGLHGLVTFYRVRNVRLSKFSSPEFGRHQYCIQAVAFDGLTVEDFVIRGGKDGIHLNSGRNFVIRNGRLRTLDDGIAVNAGEWPGYTAEMGSITDGLVENVVDEPGGECNFARVITGAWTDWHPGMKLQRADIFAHGGYTYIVYPAPLGRNETALMTPPTHRKGLWKSPEGLNIICLQPDLWREASITNVVFRNCRLEGRRGFYCEWEVNEWARLIHPDLPADRYPKADIRMENVSKAGGGPLVHGSSSARIDFVNCHTKDGVLVRMRHDKSVPHPPVREISVDGRPPQRFVGAATVTESSEPEPNAVFGVLSDIHLVPADERSVERFKKTLRYLDSRKVDGVVICGDLTHRGTIPALMGFGRVWRETFPGDRRSDGGHVERLFVYGDHETENMYCAVYTNDWTRRGWMEEMRSLDIYSNDRALQWKRAFGDDFRPIERKTVKGYDFVLAHIVMGDEPGLRWGEPLYIPGLEEFFATNTFDKTRPFFYVQHKIPRGTVGGDRIWGQDDGRTTKLLAKYPNAVAFCGHKHRSAAEERMCWQGAFTAFMVPAHYAIATEEGHENGVSSGDRPSHSPQLQMPRLDTSDGSQGFVMSLYDDRIVIERREFAQGGEVAPPWIVPIPNDGSMSFASRASRAAVPQFAKGTTVTVREISGHDRSGRATDQLSVEFPPISGGKDLPRAYDYEVTAILRKAYVRRIVGTKRVFSPKCHLAPERDKGPVVCRFGKGELPSDHDTLEFEVRPANAFGAQGEPIRSEPRSFNPTPCATTLW